MRNNHNSQFKETSILNNLTFEDYYDRLTLLALTMFKWENLPKSMDAYYLERSLYYNGLACFCFDDTYGWLSLKCMPSSELNVYEYATHYTAFSINYTKEFKKDDIILVRNNVLFKPTFKTIQLFARRLYECERTLDVNVKAQKTPVLIKCNEKERLSLLNVYQKYDGNEPVIFGKKELDTNNIEVLKTDAPFIANELLTYKQSVWSEVLTFLGINNVGREKGERLITDEVNANNESINISADVMLETRQQACKEFNEKTGLNISVKLANENVNQLFKEMEEDENGSIYGTTQNTN